MSHVHGFGLWFAIRLALTLPCVICIWWHKAPNFELSWPKLYALPCVIIDGTRWSLPIFSCHRLSSMYLQAWVTLCSNCTSVVLPFFSLWEFFLSHYLVRPLYPRTNQSGGSLLNLANFCSNQKLSSNKCTLHALTGCITTTSGRLTPKMPCIALVIIHYLWFVYVVLVDVDKSITWPSHLIYIYHLMHRMHPECSGPSLATSGM